MTRTREHSENQESNNISLAVGVLIYNTKGQVLLGKSPKWSNKWIVPGGHVEYGETLQECVHREIKEEMGINIERVEFSRVQEELFPKDFINPEKHFVFVNFTAVYTGKAEHILLNEEFNNFQFIAIETALNTLQLNSSTRSFLEFQDQQATK